ncbi:MAG: hypothetical protein K1W14_07385 [Muribaculaceae bacterium]
MNKFFIYSIIVGAVLFSVAEIQGAADTADDTTYVVEITENSDTEYLYPTPNKHRMPSKRSICLITPQGISTQMVATEDIDLFEIYSPLGECLGIFASEQDFITFIYRMDGTVEIRLHHDDGILYGYLYR